MIKSAAVSGRYLVIFYMPHVTCQESMYVEPTVLILGTAHIHHVGVAGIVSRVSAEVHQDHPTHGQHDAPLVIVCCVGPCGSNVLPIQHQG